MRALKRIFARVFHPSTAAAPSCGFVVCNLCEWSLEGPVESLFDSWRRHMYANHAWRA